MQVHAAEYDEAGYDTAGYDTAGYGAAEYDAVEYDAAEYNAVEYNAGGIAVKPLSFIIVGSGYRAMFYVRIARRYPEQFDLKYVLCRSEEKAERLIREQGAPATASVEQCENAGADFVVVAVNKTSIADVAREWILKGYPVVTETPAGSSIEKIKMLWDLKVNHSERIMVCEQYHRYPVLAGGLKAIEDGKLKDPYAVYLSVAHDYHGISLIRRMLQLGPEPVRMRGSRYEFPVTETDSRNGEITDGRIAGKLRDHVTMEFASGKAAFYDFSGVQYHSYIRSRHVTVQGQDGEWSDTILHYVNEEHKPETEYLLPYFAPRYQALETRELKELCRSWKPELLLEQAQDEYAIATMLYDMRDYLAGGPEVYPLAEALEDAYLWILMQEAVQSPGKEIISERMPWHE